MKKLIAISIFMQVIISCEKEKPNQNNLSSEHLNNEVVHQNKSAGNSANSGQIFVTDGVLCFQTIGFYESIIDHVNNTKELGTIAFIDDLNFISLKETPIYTEEEFDDEFISTILNSNKCVKIGEWYIKINPQTRLVYCCSDQINNAYSLVCAEDSSNPNVIVISIEEDVLDELKETQNSGNKAPCNENSAPSNNVTHAWDEYCDNYEVKFKASYDSYGILKKLKLRFWHNKKWGGPDQTNISLGYRYKWKKKCKSETADVSQFLGTPPIYSWQHFNDKIELTFYSGTKSLSKYYIGNSVFTGGPAVAYKNQCTNGISSITLVNALSHGY